jgi:hypothetical protein
VQQSLDVPNQRTLVTQNASQSEQSSGPREHGITFNQLGDTLAPGKPNYIVEADMNEHTQLKTSQEAESDARVESQPTARVACNDESPDAGTLRGSKETQLEAFGGQQIADN